MFRAHVLIIRMSKLYYTASGIITPIGGCPVHGLREDWMECVEYETQQHSHNPATCHCPEPNGYNQCCPIHFNIFLPSLPGLQSGLFSDFPTKALYASLPPPTCTTCLTHVIFLDMITCIIFGVSCIFMSVIKTRNFVISVQCVLKWMSF